MKHRTGKSGEAGDGQRSGSLPVPVRTVGAGVVVSKAPASDRAVEPDIGSVDLARRLAREARIRTEQLPDIDEARWMILLDIYVAMRSARDTPFMSAAHASSVPTSTAQRYIHEMTSRGLILQERSGKDQRTTHVRLTEEAMALIDQVLRRIEGLRRT